MDDGAQTRWQVKLGLSAAECEQLSEAAIMERLLDAGVSRLTAQRMLELERIGSEPGRARRHAGQKR